MSTRDNRLRLWRVTVNSARLDVAVKVCVFCGNPTWGGEKGSPPLKSEASVFGDAVRDAHSTFT